MTLTTKCICLHQSSRSGQRVAPCINFPFENQRWQIKQQLLRMRIEVKDILLLFEKLQEETNIAYVSIVIFCGLDMDSLCTLKILSKLFRSENIQYKVFPVAKYTHLGQSITDALTYDKVRLFLMINCGAVIDLTETDIITRTEAEIFLFDVHKPVHHRNVESPRVKVVDDGHGEMEKCPTSDTYDKMNQLNEIDLDSDPEDYEEGAQCRQKREMKSRLRAQREVMGRAISNYYSHQFFGQPSSHSAYQLVRNLNKANNEYLWFAIVGMTSMFIEQKLSKEALDRLTQLFQADAAKNNSGQPKDRGEIASRKGFQFALLDHWSLYDSMLHSSYLFAKMQLWQDRGLTRLHEFIHHIGISLQEAKQLYKYMPAEGQRKLDSSIFAAAEKFGLLQVTYLSFARNLDYSAPFMASDVVHVLTSVLEAPPKPPVPYAELSGHQVKCFWEAYDLLEGGAQQVGRRVETCKGILKVLMTQARNVMERDHLITTNSLSIANIRGDSENRLLFQHPSTLIRLAYLLMAMIREHKRTRTPRPLVANWIAMENELCLSVGVSIEHKNGLGHRFDAVTSKLGIEAEQDSFQANIIAFRKDHLSAFIKEISRS